MAATIVAAFLCLWFKEDFGSVEIYCGLLKS